MASQSSVRYSRDGELLVSVEDALEIIPTEVLEVEEDIIDSSVQDFDPYSEETNVDSDIEADGGEEEDEDVPAHEPQQVSESDTDTEMGEEIDDFRAVYADDWTDNLDSFLLDHPFTGTPGLSSDWSVNTQPLQFCQLLLLVLQRHAADDS